MSQLDPRNSGNLYKNAVYNLTEGVSLVEDDAGVWLYIVSSSSAFTINLPSPNYGLCYYIVIASSALSNNITVSSSSANINGQVCSANDVLLSDLSLKLANSKSNIILSSANSKKGDLHYIHSDGDRWYVNSQVSLNTAVSFS